MRAAYYETTGPAREVLRIARVEMPRPGPGEVLVRIAVSGVNPSDVKKRAGAMPAPAAYPRIIPHSDGAGRIEVVGPGVADRVGQRVWLWNAQWGRSEGTAAEYVALPTEQAVPLPDDVPYEVGACLGIPARTGWVAARWGRPGRVLVQGGAGAVGLVAAAAAAEAGAEVIATVSSEEKAAAAHAAGAAHLIRRDYEDVAEAVLRLTGGAGVDHIVEVDFGANWRTDAVVLATGGTVAAYSSPSAPRFELDYYAFAARAARLRFVQVYLLEPEERRAAEAGIARLLASGRLPAPIAARFSLDEIAAAHEMQETGRPFGNIVVEIAPDA